MCIGLWALEHPEYALILCTNRDESLSRPTRNATFHSFGHGDDDPDHTGHILSGIDLVAGGTWFGLNRAGRIALLTNISEPHSEYPCSRGYLTSSFLESDLSEPLIKEGEITHEEDPIHNLINVARDAKFPGFNLLLLAPRALQHQPESPIGSSSTRAHTFPSSPSFAFDAILVTNGGGGGPITFRTLTEEERLCGGVSNGVDGNGGNQWKKVIQGTQFLKTFLDGHLSESEIVEGLFKILSWRSPEPIHSRADLQNTIYVESLQVRNGSSSDDDMNLYGTRLSTVLLIRRDGRVLFIERDAHKLRDPASQQDTSPDRAFRFTINRDPTTHVHV